MADYQEGIRIAEVYKKIMDGEIPVEPDLKQPILDAFLEHGIDEVNGVRYWSKEYVPDFILRLNEMIEEVLADKENTEEHLNLHKRLYVRLYRIRRVVKNLLKQEGEGS